MGIDFRGREIAGLEAALGPLAYLAAALGPLACLAAALHYAKRSEKTKFSS